MTRQKNGALNTVCPMNGGGFRGVTKEGSFRARRGGTKKKIAGRKRRGVIEVAGSAIRISGKGN